MQWYSENVLLMTQYFALTQPQISEYKTNYFFNSLFMIDVNMERFNEDKVILMALFTL